MVEKKRSSKAKLNKSKIGKKKDNPTVRNKKKLEKKGNIKEDMNKNKKAQVSLEMIIIIGVLILGAVILATVLIGFTGDKVDQAGEIDQAASSTINDFIKDLTNPEDYEPISGVGSNCVLTLSSNPPAGGTVSGAGTFSCGTSVTATATALSGYTFNNWTTPTGSLSTNPYTFNLNSNTSLTANFSSTVPSTYTLNVSRSGSGNGTVVSSSPGINCGSDCSENYSSGTSVTLTANSVTGHNFGGWSGDCSGTNTTCTVSMTQARNVTATFNLPTTYTLNLIENPDEPNATLVGAGNYSVGTVVPISITSTGPIMFINWTDGSGNIISSNQSFNYTMPSANTTLTANFNLAPPITYLLSVTKNGTGSGNVFASTVGIDCGSTCSYSYNQGTMVTLNATANAGSSFSGWSGAGCSGTGTCIVTMDAAKSVIATFSPVVVYSEFISTWDTTKTSTGSSASNQITLPLVSTGVYDFNVDWGDGSKSVVTSWNDSDKTHTYSTSGVKTIKITGTIKGFRFNNSGDRLKLTNISKWGPLNLGNEGAYFFGANNLTITATDILDLNGTTNLMNAFSGCIYMSTIPSINDWNVSAVDYMDAMFYDSYSFNQSLDKWDVSNVKSMSYMFSFAYNFNQPLNNWNVLNVTNMTGMFQNATSFNQPLNNWNVSNVTNMGSMFNSASSFNQPLNDWNVSKVTNMAGMFQNATSFNQPLNNWNVSNVTNMNGMFYGNLINGSSFNQNINNWNVSNVTDMGSMFNSATSFNQPLYNWGVWNVTDMSAMFFGATSFNQNINNWTVSKVRTMTSMFYQASSFNQPLNNWNVSEVINMQDMFNSASSFNQPLNNWNVSKVATMYRMFNNATLFNQDLSSWNVSGISNYIGISNTSLSVENYTKLLIAWSQNTSLKNNVRLDVGSTRYDNSALSARNILRTTYNWSITDGGMQ